MQTITEATPTPKRRRSTTKAIDPIERIKAEFATAYGAHGDDQSAVLIAVGEAIDADDSLREHVADTLIEAGLRAFVADWWRSDRWSVKRAERAEAETKKGKAKGKKFKAAASKGAQTHGATASLLEWRLPRACGGKRVRDASIDELRNAAVYFKERAATLAGQAGEATNRAAWLNDVADHKAKGAEISDDLALALWRSRVK